MCMCLWRLWTSLGRITCHCWWSVDISEHGGAGGSVAPSLLINWEPARRGQAGLWGGYEWGGGVQGRGGCDNKGDALLLQSYPLGAENQQGMGKGNKSHPRSFLEQNKWAGGQLGLGGHRLLFLPKAAQLSALSSNCLQVTYGHWSVGPALWFPTGPPLTFYYSALAVPPCFTVLLTSYYKNYLKVLDLETIFL